MSQSIKDFESAITELEKIVKQLEDGDLALDKSLALFERGVELSRYCHDQLRLVMPAEDDRWHVPGQPPAGPECLLCAKQDLGLLLQMVLPTTVGRVA